MRLLVCAAFPLNGIAYKHHAGLLCGQDTGPTGLNRGIRPVSVGLVLIHFLHVEHFFVVVILYNERIPSISRQIELGVAKLIGRKAA